MTVVCIIPPAATDHDHNWLCNDSNERKVDVWVYNSLILQACHRTHEKLEMHADFTFFIIYYFSEIAIFV